MRLHVAERPERRKLGKSGDARVLGHQHLWIGCDGDEYVDWQRVVCWCEDAGRARKVESSERVVNEQAPSVSTREPLNGHATAVCPQLISALPVAIRIGGAL